MSRIDWTEDDLRRATRNLEIFHGRLLLVSCHTKGKPVRERCRRAALLIGVAIEAMKNEPTSLNIDEVTTQLQKGVSPYGLDVVPKQAS